MIRKAKRFCLEAAQDGGFSWRKKLLLFGKKQLPHNVRALAHCFLLLIFLLPHLSKKLRPKRCCVPRRARHAQNIRTANLPGNIYSYPFRAGSHQQLPTISSLSGNTTHNLFPKFTENTSLSGLRYYCPNSYPLPSAAIATQVYPARPLISGLVNAALLLPVLFLACRRVALTLL